MPAGRGHEPSIVAALCHCIFGDRAMASAGDWPPRSISDLMQHSPSIDGSRALIEQGLRALDAAVLEDTGLGFAQLARPRQLAVLFCLEAGGLALPQDQAEVFIDTFLTLAAQVYLRDGFAQETG